MQRNDKDRRNKINPGRIADSEKPIKGCKRTERKKARRSKTSAIEASMAEAI